MNYYIADWHFGHANCIYFDNRPFNDVLDMNIELIKNWKSVVKDTDTVYVLGDMFWRTSERKMIEVLEELSGKKVLIIGNHDKQITNCKAKDCFEKCVEYLEVEDEGRRVVLCHYPITCFKNHYYGWYHLYGHVHSSFEWNITEKQKELMTSLYDKECKMYNVGVMMTYMNYTPRTLTQIIESNEKRNQSIK